MQQETTLLSFPRRYGTSEIIKEKKNMARHDCLYPEGKGWKKNSLTNISISWKCLNSWLDKVWCFEWNEQQSEASRSGE